MPFDIDSWKSSVKDSLPASRYELAVSPPVGGGDEIRIRTESVSAPGISFLSVDNYPYAGTGVALNIPYRYNPQEVSMTHTVDNKANIYKTFRDWGNKIVDLEGGSKKFAAYYMDEYTVQMSLTLFDQQNKMAKIVIFREAFPIVVEPMSLGWGQHDEIARFSVSYRFRTFEVI